MERHSDRSSNDFYRNGHARTDRTYLSDSICSLIRNDGLVFIEASFGYGKTTLLDEIYHLWRSRYSHDCPVLTINLSSQKFDLFQRSYASRRVSGSTASYATFAAWRDVQNTFPSGRRRPASVSDSLSASLPDLSDLQQQAPGLFAGIEDEAHVRWIWATLCSGAPQWLHKISSIEGSSTSVSGDHYPLVLIDDLSLQGNREMRSSFARALRIWHAFGLRFVVASTPGDGIRNEFFPDSACYTNYDLTISPAEFNLWKRDLCLGIGEEAFSVTHGVPALVSACRYLGKDEPLLHNTSVVKVAKSLFSSCTREPATPGIQHLKRLIPLLGSGSFDDLLWADPLVCLNDIESVQQLYPLYGLDPERKSFDCMDLPLEEGDEILLSLSSSNASMLTRCVELLLQRNRYERALSLTELLPDVELVRLFLYDPVTCADIAPLDIVRQARHIADDPQKLRDISALWKAMDRSEAGESDVPVSDSFDHRDRASDAVGCFLSAFEHLGRGKRGRKYSGNSEAIRIIDAIWASWHLKALTKNDAGDSVSRRIDYYGERTLLCQELVRTAVVGDQEKHAKLCDIILADVIKKTNVSDRFLLHHISVTTLLCGDVERLQDYLRPLVQAPRAHFEVESGQIPTCATTTMLVADGVFAAIVLDKPAERKNAESMLDFLRRLRVSVESKGLVLPTAQLCLLEAFAQIICGFESRALEPLGHAISLLGAQGSDFGQMLGLFGKACCELSEGDREAALVSTIAASRIANRLGIDRWIDTAELLKMIAVGLPDNRRTSLIQFESQAKSMQEKPQRISVAALLHHALLGVACECTKEAREAFDQIVERGPLATLLAGALIRSAGAFLSLAHGCLPVELRRASRGYASDRIPLSSLVWGTQDIEAKHPLTIRLLRDTCVELNGHRIDDKHWGRKMSKALLVCLALTPDQSITRERMARLLWPSGNPDNMRQNLSVVLSALRKVLGQSNNGPQYILADHETIALNLQLTRVDVLDFERAARIALSADEGVDDLTLIRTGEQIDRDYGSGIEHRWVEFNGLCGSRAHELDELFCDCMVHVAGIALQLGKPTDALRLARHAQRACDDRPDVQLLIIQACEMLRAGGDVNEMT